MDWVTDWLNDWCYVMLYDSWIIVTFEFFGSSCLKHWGTKSWSNKSHFQMTQTELNRCEVRIVSLHPSAVFNYTVVFLPHLKNSHPSNVVLPQKVKDQSSSVCSSWKWPLRLSLSSLLQHPLFSLPPRQMRWNVNSSWANPLSRSAFKVASWMEDGWL